VGVSGGAVAAVVSGILYVVFDRIGGMGLLRLSGTVPFYNIIEL